MSIRKKIILWIILPLVAVGFVSSYLYYLEQTKEEIERIRALGELTGYVIEESLGNALLAKDYARINKVMGDLRAVRELKSLLLLNRDGVIRAGSGELQGARLSYSDPRCRGCHEGQRSLLMKDSDTLRVVQPILNKTECHRCHSPSIKYNGIFVIDFSLAEMKHRAATAFIKGLVPVLVLLITLGAVLFLIIRTNVTERLERVTTYIERFKDSDYSVRIPPVGNDEITKLEHDFNAMAGAINTAQETLRRSSETHFVISRLLRLSLESLSLEETLKQALEIVLSVTWLTIEPRGAIFLIDSAGDLVLNTSRGLTGQQLRTCELVPRGICLCGLAADTQEVQFADCIDERHAIQYEGMAQHGHYCVPILFLGETIGVLNTYLAAHHLRSREEEDFFKAIANVLAGIIHRKKLEKEREKLVDDLQITLDMVSNSRKMWQETFDNIKDLIFIHDRESRIIRANRAFSDYCGSRPQEVLGRKWHEIFPGFDPAVNTCPDMTVLDAGQPVSTEMRLSATGRIFNLSAFPYYSDEQRIIGAVCVARDLTEEKERDMRLIMSERLASLGQMASGIAHEINNPLASISGCAEGLLDSVNRQQYDPPLFERYLRIIVEEIARCKHITTSMLSFVRTATPEKKPVNLNESLSKALELIGLQGRLDEVVVIKHLQDDLPFVKGNESELRQVFLALMSNALDAMQDRGTLQIVTGQTAQAEDGQVFVEISDSGSGVPDDLLYRIFDPFFTTKADKGGTGLGLSIARKIILNHHGDITVSSEEGIGASFRLEFPI